MGCAQITGYVRLLLVLSRRRDIPPVLRRRRRISIYYYYIFLFIFCLFSISRSLPASSYHDQGVFVLQDNDHAMIRNLATDAAGGIGAQRLDVSHFLVYPCGLIRGALLALGLSAAVSAEAPSPPAVNFTVRIT